MKNAIKFFYNLEVDSIRQLNDKYFLESKNVFYCLEKTDIDIENKYQIISRYPFLYKIVKNNQNSIVTKINDKNYVLLVIDKNTRIIDINDIYNFGNIYLYLNDIDPVKRAIQFWSDRVDYIEYQLNQIGKKYPILRISFAYYNGLTENAIELLKTIDGSRINVYLMHHRIRIDDKIFDLCNPLNIVFDSRIRDVCEYLKSSFFSGKNIYEDATKYLVKLSQDEIVFFMSRLLYPSYYYDIFDSVLENKNENELDYILSKVIDYEKELKRIYVFIRDKYIIPEIEWLNE